MLTMHNLKLSGFNRQKTMNGSTRKRDDEDITTQVFTFGELAAATKNFHPQKLVGKGGFGRVYKGQLKHNNQVSHCSLTLHSPCVF